MVTNHCLQQLRIQRNWRQEYLAEQLGAHVSTIQRWERGCRQPTPYYRAKLCELFETSAQALGLLEDESQPLPQLCTSDIPSTPESAAFTEEYALWTVHSPRNPYFTGREDLLAALEQHFSRSFHMQAIKGLGGISKTQIAIEYAYRARDRGRYTHTLWLAAASEEALLASFVALSELVPALRSVRETDQHLLATRVIRWLEQCPDPWLLIVDNADDLSFLPAYLPVQGHGSILLTTRASAVGALASSLEIEPLSLEEGVQLLLHRAQRAVSATPEEREDAGTIVRTLDRLPLAIDQAGAYLEETGCRLQDYIQIFQTYEYALLARRGMQACGYPDSLVTTWVRSFQRIEQSHPAAAEFLKCCAFVASNDISEELFTKGARYWPAALREAVTDRFRFNQLLETVQAFSLVKRVGEEGRLSLYRLVQVVLRACMTMQEQREWAQRLLLAVHAPLPPDPEEEVAAWQQGAMLVRAGTGLQYAVSGVSSAPS